MAAILQNGSLKTFCVQLNVFHATHVHQHAVLLPEWDDISHWQWFSWNNLNFYEYIIKCALYLEHKAQTKLKSSLNCSLILSTKHITLIHSQD